MCQPRPSAFQCSATMNSVTLPSLTVGMTAPSAPHMTFGALVVIDPSWSFAGRGGRRCGESRLFSPMIRSTRLRPTPDAVDHPQPRPDLAVPLAGPRRARQVVANGGEQVFVAVPRFRTASAGRVLLWPSLLASAVVERGSRDAPDRADPLHAIRLAGRRRGRGGHQRDLLRA